MFPLILTVLNWDENRGVQESLLRAVSLRGNIPSLGFRAWADMKE